MQAPHERRVDETFGWFPGSAAIAALFVVMGQAMNVMARESLAVEDLEVIGGALAVTALFGFWEIWRRTRPTSLILIGGHLGIYRKGQLAEIAGFGQLTHYRLSVINTMREVMLFGIVGLGGLLGVLGTLSNGHFAGAFYSFAALAVGAGGLASCIWQRIMCVHYWIPKSGGTETVVLRKKELTRVGWPIY
jgi:hypothetical protein